MAEPWPVLNGLFARPPKIESDFHMVLEARWNLSGLIVDLFDGVLGGSLLDAVTEVVLLQPGPVEIPVADPVGCLHVAKRCAAWRADAVHAELVGLLF